MRKILIPALALIWAVSSAQSTKMGDYHLDQTYKMDARGIITLSSSDANVFITGSSRSDVHVKIDRIMETRGFVWGTQEFGVDITENNGNLLIKERSGSGATVAVVGYIHEKYTINIEAPEGVSLTLRGDDGDYYIRTVHGDMDLNIDDADVELTGCKGSNFKIRIDDGKISMHEGRGTLDVTADDADVKIQNGKFSKIMANMDDGDLMIETTLADNGDYYMDCQDGLISFTVLSGGGDFSIRHDDARVYTEGLFEELERTERRTTLKLPKGNARVEIHADDARIRLSSR
jgi:hypothetical protein